ncbi:DNA-directed RNA polymerase core subunit rpc40 [Stygiomarasmius scandens]|uniref:DNA-directed RNA polymerases I and III subunit RPAC1 n=1 Tax=Marasmiellus scandens TaxID=2682957 RepID=A0ABR1JWI8_9AGAR
MDVNPRRLVGVTAERATHVSSTDFPGHYPNEDHSWNLSQFRQNLKAEVQRLSNRSIEFDIVGVDASIANAFRRIMIAEVPTVAAERVYIFNNTSVVQDEVLSHRIGLVPLNVDPRNLDMKADVEDPGTDRDTIIFRAHILCERNPKAPKGSEDPKELYKNHEFLSSHLVWQPAGEQASLMMKDIGPLNLNIVLAKLRPGQEIEMELHAVKGVGKDHAKFSPVATASYRLHPNIVITKPIPMHRAEEFKNCFAPGVVVVDRVKKVVKIDPKGMRNDTVTREVLRDPEFSDMVQLSRIRDFFIFNVESESAYAPEELLPEAINIMRGKIADIRRSAESLLSTGGDNGGDVPMADP